MIETTQEDLYREAEIVGFDGHPRAVCGLCLPIAKLRDEDAYFLMEDTPADGGRVSFRSFSKEEKDALVQEQRITMLARPRNLSSWPIPSKLRVVYFTPTLLSSLGERGAASIDSALDLVPGNRLETPPPHGGAFAAPLKESEAEQLMNQWAGNLLRVAQAHLRDFLSTAQEHARQEAERFVDMARYAVRDHSLRQDLFLRHAAVLRLSETPERARNVYVLASLEFPYWKEEDFERQLYWLIEGLRQQSGARREATFGYATVQNSVGVEEAMSDDETVRALEKLGRKKPDNGDNTSLTQRLYYRLREDEFFAKLLSGPTRSAPSSLNLMAFLDQHDPCSADPFVQALLRGLNSQVDATV